MTILQINECCNGSTGTTMTDLAFRLKEEGIESYVAFGQGKSSYTDSYCVGTRIEKLIHSFVFTRILGLHGYGSVFSTFRFLRWVDSIKPDIIHLRNLHTNFINYPLLYRYIIKHKIPVVMTLHDCYNFSGQCEHYVGVGCDKFTKGCGKCPFLHHTIAPSWFFDWSHWLIKQKQKWYSQIPNMTVIGVSKWLKSEADNSILSGNGHKITYIYNWIDTKLFYPRSKDEVNAIRNKYNLDEHTKYLVTVGAGWRSDTTKYQEAVKLADKLPEGYQLVLVGGVVDGSTLPDNIKVIGYTESPIELAALYTMAEAYIHLSVCDTFGKVIAEAMACGTCPVVYNSTACPETTGGFGIIVTPHDVDAILNNLDKLSMTEEEMQSMIQYVENNYNKGKNIQKYIDVYKSIISK